MSKRTKAPQIPDIYKSLPAIGKEMGSKTITISKSGDVFIFNSPQEDHIITEARAHQLAGFDTFCELPSNTLTELHEFAFREGHSVKLDKMDVAKYTWCKLTQMGKNRTGPGHTDPATQSATAPAVKGERKSTYATRLYCAIGDKPSALPAQAIACWVILKESTPEGATGIIESEFKKKIEERAAELKTRQDPWRIFQYYRARLVKENHLRHD